LEGFPSDKVTVLSQHVVVGEALIHQGVSRAFGHRVPILLVKISKAYVFHNSSNEKLGESANFSPEWQQLNCHGAN
jgi:hypothetical protein